MEGAVDVVVVGRRQYDSRLTTTRRCARERDTTKLVVQSAGPVQSRIQMGLGQVNTSSTGDRRPLSGRVDVVVHRYVKFRQFSMEH